MNGSNFLRSITSTRTIYIFGYFECTLLVPVLFVSSFLLNEISSLPLYGKSVINRPESLSFFLCFHVTYGLVGRVKFPLDGKRMILQKFLMLDLIQNSLFFIFQSKVKPNFQSIDLSGLQFLCEIEAQQIPSLEIFGR
jgi:hypothetical protein